MTDDLSPELKAELDGILGTAYAAELLQPFVNAAKERGMNPEETLAFVKQGVRDGMRRAIVKQMAADPEVAWDEPEMFDAMLRVARGQFE